MVGEGFKIRVAGAFFLQSRYFLPEILKILFWKKKKVKRESTKLLKIHSPSSSR